MEMIDFTVLMNVIGLLTLFTNVFTEVLKKSFTNFPAQLTATVVSMALTIVSFFAYAAISGLEIQWYMIFGAIVVGFFVSYAAQFGFDKLKEMINKYKNNKEWDDNVH